MATVKTTGSGDQLRAITKVVDGERRVSCECCEKEPFCCMYPAGSTFSDNLPDNLNVTWTGQFVGGVEKNGSEYENQAFNIVLRVGDSGLWTLFNNTTDPPITRTVGLCLIRDDGENNPDPTGLVSDNFLDVYTISAFDAEGEFIYSDIVVRFALCAWGSDASGLAFNVGQNQSWGCNVFESGGFKLGSQNSPVGEYTLDSGPFAGGSIFVGSSPT